MGLLQAAPPQNKQEETTLVWCILRSSSLRLVYNPHLAGPSCPLPGLLVSVAGAALANPPLLFNSLSRWVALPGKRFFAFSLARQLLPALSGAAREDSQMNQREFFPVILAKFA